MKNFFGCREPPGPLAVFRFRCYNRDDTFRIIGGHYGTCHAAGACGQACIAMIAGRKIEDVIRIMKTDGPTSIGQLTGAPDHFGIGHAAKNVRISKKDPVPYGCSILTVHTDAGYTHRTLLNDGKYYDPGFGLIEGEYPHGKITSFLAILG